MALCPRLDGRPLLSRGAISGLQEAGGNARWLSSPCPRCIADGSARRAADPLSDLGVEAAPGLAGGVCLGRWRAAARPPMRIVLTLPAKCGTFSVVAGPPIASLSRRAPSWLHQQNGLRWQSAPTTRRVVLLNGHTRLPGRSCRVARTRSRTLVTPQEGRQARRSRRRPDRMPDLALGRADRPSPFLGTPHEGSAVAFASGRIEIEIVAGHH